MKKISFIIMFSIMALSPVFVRADELSAAWKDKIQHHQPSSNNPDFPRICGLWNKISREENVAVTFKFMADGTYKMVMTSRENGQQILDEAGIWRIDGGNIVTHRAVIVKNGQPMMTDPEDKHFIAAIPYTIAPDGDMVLFIDGKNAHFHRVSQ